MRKLLLLGIGLLLSTSVYAEDLFLGAYYVSFYQEQQDQRFKDIQKIKAIGFDSIATPLGFKDMGFVEECKKNGINVIWEGNEGPREMAIKLFSAHENIKMFVVADDANYKDLETLRKDILEFEELLPDGKETYITVSKSADHVTYANLADNYAIQLYVNKEGTLRRWVWEDMVSARAITKGKLIANLQLIKNNTPNMEPYKSDPVWQAHEYPSVAYIETSMYMAMCAGADGILFYTLYDAFIHPDKEPKFTKGNYILERWDYVRGLTDIFQRFIKYKKYFREGKRISFDEGRLVGASFILPDGKAIKVFCDTFEYNPKVIIQEGKITTSTKENLDVVI